MSSNSKPGCLSGCGTCILGLIVFVIIVSMLGGGSVKSKPATPTPVPTAVRTVPPSSASLQEILQWHAERYLVKEITLRVASESSAAPGEGIVVVDWDYNKSSSLQYSFSSVLDYVLQIARDMSKYDACKQLVFTVYCPAVDKYGNAVETIGATFTLKASTMAKINYAYMLKRTRVDQRTVLSIFDHYYLQPFVKSEVTSLN